MGKTRVKEWRQSRQSNGMGRWKEDGGGMRHALRKFRRLLMALEYENRILLLRISYPEYYALQGIHELCIWKPDTSAIPVQ